MQINKANLQKATDKNVNLKTLYKKKSKNQKYLYLYKNWNKLFP